LRYGINYDELLKTIWENKEKNKEEKRGEGRFSNLAL